MHVCIESMYVHEYGLVFFPLRIKQWVVCEVIVSQGHLAFGSMYVHDFGNTYDERSGRG